MSIQHTSYSFFGDNLRVSIAKDKRQCFVRFTGNGQTDDGNKIFKHELIVNNTSELIRSFMPFIKAMDTTFIDKGGLRNTNMDIVLTDTVMNAIYYYNDENSNRFEVYKQLLNGMNINSIDTGRAVIRAWIHSRINQLLNDSRCCVACPDSFVPGNVYIYYDKYVDGAIHNTTSVVYVFHDGIIYNYVTVKQDFDLYRVLSCVVDLIKDDDPIIQNCGEYIYKMATTIYTIADKQHIRKLPLNKVYAEFCKIMYDKAGGSSCYRIIERISNMPKMRMSWLNPKLSEFIDNT